MEHDRALLDAFREGRRDAMEQVYRRYVLDVASFLRNGFMYLTDGQPTRFAGMSSSFELEGVVQEVFARAFAPAARRTYDGVRPYGGFLIGIARNVMLDQLRRRARRGEVLTAPALLDEVGAATPAEEPEEERAGRVLVQAFLDQACEDRDRRLYDLRYRRELSQVDAAREAGLTRIQVRRWETRFRERLLRFLKRAGYLRDR
jgi:RNA polymerase sigma-70 factor (ECF subfamily)